MTPKYENPDNKLIAVIGTTVARVVLYICCAIVLGMWIDSCQLDENTVANCEDSCKGYGTHMESVTTRECVCAPPTSIGPGADAWVLPK